MNMIVWLLVQEVRVCVLRWVFLSTYVFVCVFSDL